jgi:hypothetical protein
MQTLALEVATTFVDDAAALVLPRRRALRQALEQTFRQTWTNRQAMRRQRSWRNCLFPLRGLRDLT